MKLKTTISIGTNRKRTVFEKTYPMSIYLPAWAITPDDYMYVETFTQKSKPVKNHIIWLLFILKLFIDSNCISKIRVYARKTAVKGGLVDFSLEVARRVTNYFENVYFNISEAVPPKIGIILKEINQKNIFILKFKNNKKRLGWIAKFFWCYGTLGHDIVW
jgi:hypothetical protein